MHFSYYLFLVWVRSNWPPTALCYDRYQVNIIDDE